MNFELVSNTPRPNDPVVAVNVLSRGDFYFVEFSIRGDRDGIVMPEVLDESERKGDLAEESHIELFAADKESSAYTQFIFSLGNRWNCFNFTNYKEGKTQPQMDEMDMQIMPVKMVYRLSIMLPADMLNDRLCGITTVLKYSDGTESVWSLKDAPAPADSHNRDNFVAEFVGETLNISDDRNSQRLDGIVDAMKNQDNGLSC